MAEQQPERGVDLDQDQFCCSVCLDLRSVLSESFFRCLLAMANKKIQFHMYELVKVEATFRASDIDVLNFQVSDLHTPIGEETKPHLLSRKRLRLINSLVVCLL
ncbi:hypothetical protein VZT92_019618 [Zoarces viviparus]|uniref:Uncharacterized protein n=1 Tax=Zoarces viviparus TaxID=48416 RepID=A0AAW1ELN0_ZOAVI